MRRRCRLTLPTHTDTQRQHTQRHYQTNYITNFRFDNFSVLWRRRIARVSLTHPPPSIKSIKTFIHMTLDSLIVIISVAIALVMRPLSIWTHLCIVYVCLICVCVCVCVFNYISEKPVPKPHQTSGQRSSPIVNIDCRNTKCSEI